MKPRKTAARRKPKVRPKRKVASLPASTSGAPAMNDHFDEPSIPARNEAVSVEGLGPTRAQTEDTDFCGLCNETIMDASDLH